jgi:hypothetical protein
VEIDPKYTVVELGKTVKQGEGWLVTSTQPVEDIILTAAEHYYQVPVSEGYGLSLYYARPQDEEAALVLMKDGVWALDFFKGWLGEYKEQRHLKLCITPRERGGGYVRPGMIVMQAMSFHGLAHELAHLWWAKDLPGRIG